MLAAERENVSGGENGSIMAVSLDREALAQLEALLRQGKSQVECAKILGVSVRTIGQVVARMKA